MGAAEGDKRVDDRLRVLSGALRTFAEAAMDYERLLDVIARTVGGRDGCVLRLLSDGGWLSVVASHLPLEAHIHDAEALARVRTHVAAQHNVAEHAGLRRVIETGEPVLVPIVDLEELRLAATAQLVEVYETIGIHSHLLVALRDRGVSIGSLAVLRFDPALPSFDEQDRDMAQALADHAALAIGNARSYAAERAARDAADKATARFARLSEAGVIGTVVIDLDDRSVVDVNDTLLHMIGHSRDELVSGRVPWASLTGPEWSDVDARAIEQLTATGVAGLREKEFIRKDGTRVPVLVGSAMLGGTTECISFVLDLTERKEAERGRREAERRAQRMVESATVGIWTVGADGRTTFMNARMADILGRDVAVAVTMPTTEFFFAEDRPAMAERLAKRRDGLAGPFEQRFRRPDGAVGVLSVDSSPLYDAQGRYEGVLGIATDITERHRAEDAVRASEARYRRLGESGVVGIIITDGSGQIVEANDTFLNMLGYSRDELGSGLVSWKAITPPQWSDISTAASEQLRLHGVARPWEKEYIRKDSRRVPVLVGVATLDDGTNISLSIDLTERKQAEAGRIHAEDALRQSEEQLRQSQKMEAVGRLAGGVAHDFNNVLSVILGYGEMLLADMKPDDPVRADIEEIHKAGKRATDLTRQLLMFSRQQVLAPKVLDLNAVLTSMDKMLQRIVGADVDLVSLPTHPLGRVRADPSNIEQVIMNLVVNARDAMPRGGKLTMETDDVVLDDAYAQAHLGVKPGPHVMLAVSDTGTGIDKATLARIFEPFFTTKESGKGTGLGLSTVFGVVQQSGGSVWVYSEVGKGTTFKVYLPRVDAAVEVTEETVPPATLQGSETILLVEDDDQVRIVARAILRKAGYHVIDARNAGEALLHSEKHPTTIHLLLSDVVMPQVSGPELARRLASARPDMKVLCMSGYTDDSIVRHGVLEAHIAYLQKPITPEALTTRVREVLDGLSNGSTRREG